MWDILSHSRRTCRAHRLLLGWLLLLAAGLLGPRAWAMAAGPAITVTKSATLVGDQNNNGQVDPGDTLRYTITITNSGDAAITGGQLNDTIDPHTTLVAGSLQATPLARNDSGYSTVGNVPLTVRVAQGLLINDSDPDGTGGLTVIAFATTSSNGGLVSVAADGSFIYTPPPGFSGLDTFSYTVDDGEGNHATATVSITVGQVVWFINNAGSGPGDGRLTTPFPNIADFNARAADKPGDIIFIYQGAAGYSDPLTLLNTQQLIGQGVGLTVAPNLTMTATAPPIIAHVRLATGNTVRGVNLMTNSDVALSGANVGALTIDHVAITSSGTGAVALQGGSATMTVTLDSVTATGGVHGIDLQNTRGQVTVNGGAIRNTSGHAIYLFNNTGPLDFTLRNSTITNTALLQNGLHLEIINSGSFGQVTVQNNLFADSGSTGVRASIGGTGRIDLIDVGHNTFRGNRYGVDLATNGAATVNFDIHDNLTMIGDQTQVYVAANDALPNDGFGPTMSGHIRNNQITLNPTAAGIAIWVISNGDGRVTANIADNQVTDFGDSGIDVEALGGRGAMHVRIADNILTTTAAAPYAGLYLRSGDGTPGETSLLCVNLSSNHVDSGSARDYYLERATPDSTVFQLQGLTPSPATAAEVAAFLPTTDAAPPVTTVVAEGNYVNATCNPVSLPTLAGTLAVDQSDSAAGPAASPKSDSSPAIDTLPPAPTFRAGTIALDLGALAAGQAMVITFDVQVNPPFTGEQVCNQGLVSGSNISPVATDDPAMAGSADPTCTPVVPPDVNAPDTVMESAPPNPSHSATASFVFSGTDDVTPSATLTFFCQLDDGDVAACTPPQTYSGLADGLHTFQVRAVDSSGNVDPTPATFTWQIDTVVPVPDLTAVKINNRNGNTVFGQSWTWLITVTNPGRAAASFADGELLLLDNLPELDLTYGAPMLLNVTNVTGADQLSCTLDNNDLRCTASGGPVTIGATTGAFAVQFAAVARTAGLYANPRPGGACQVDPANLVEEGDEGNNTCADSVTVAAPDLTITKTHAGDFTLGQPSAQYTITVQNVGSSATSGSVTVADELPTGLTAIAFTGSGWTCTLMPLHCTRSDPLAPGAAYPALVLTVAVTDNAPEALINRVTVTGGNDANLTNNSATDLTLLRGSDYALFLPIVLRMASSQQ